MSRHTLRVARCAIALITVLGATCGALLEPAPVAANTVPTQGGAPLFTHPGYNYGPSALAIAGGTQVWWCGQGTAATGYFDNIFYSEYSDATGSWSTPQAVIVPQVGSWDENSACDPSVLHVPMVNPADGQTYAYECYYGSATNTRFGDGDIGVAFSNDGVNWVKYPTPLVTEQGPTTNTYGAGQPSVIALPTGGFLMIHEDSSVDGQNALWARQSSDGIHFGAPTRVSLAGHPLMQQSIPITGVGSHFAYDPSTGDIVGALEGVENVGDREARAFAVQQIPLSDLLAGVGTWEPLGVVDSALTNSYLNLDPALLRDGNGDLPAGTPLTAWWAEGGNDPTTWNLYSGTIDPTLNAVPLREWSNQVDTWDTTGLADTTTRSAPGAAPPYTPGPVLADLATVPLPGMVAVNQCFAPAAASPPQAPAGDLTLSGPGQHYLTTGACTSSNDAPAVSLGVEGWVYPYQAVGTVPLYVCRGATRYVTTSADTCPSGGVQLGVLGYALPATSAPAQWSPPAPHPACRPRKSCPAAAPGSIVFPLNEVTTDTTGSYLADTTGAYRAQVTGSALDSAVSMVEAPADDPYGLAAEVDQANNAGAPYLSIAGLPLGNTGAWTLSVDMRMAVPPGGELNNSNAPSLSGINEFPISIGPADSPFQHVYVQLDAGEILVVSKNSTEQIVIPDVLLDGGWHTVSLAVTAKTLSLVVDGTTMGAMVLQAPITGTVPVRLAHYCTATPLGYSGALGDLTLTAPQPTATLP